MGGADGVVAVEGELAAGHPRGGEQAGDSRAVKEVSAAANDSSASASSAELHQRAAKDELDVADLLAGVLAVTEQLERGASLLVGQLRAGRCAGRPGRARDGVAGLGLARGVEERRDRQLQEPDRLLVPAEEERDPTEVVEDAADVGTVTDQGVKVSCLLGVAAGDEELPSRSAIEAARKLMSAAARGSPIASPSSSAASMSARAALKSRWRW